MPGGERKLVILLQNSGKVPAMAACTKCQRKFFTPDSLLRDSAAAKEYLQEKFDQHDCPDSRKRTRWQ